MQARTLLGAALLATSAPLFAAKVTIPPGASVTMTSGTLALECADLDVQGTLSTGAGTIGKARNVSISPGATLDAGSATIHVGGDWSNAGAFARGTSSVVFADGCSTAPAQITGSTAFASLSLTSTSGRTFVLPAGAATSVATSLTLSGVPGSPIQVVSSNPSQPTSIALATGASVSSTNTQLGTNVALAPSTSLDAAPAALAFGGQSMRTTAPAQSVTLTNGGSSALAGIAITAPLPYAVTHECATVAAGATCNANVTFTPTSEGALDATLTIQSSAGTKTVSLTGTGERSLVTHYYRSILGRAPDAGGKAHWESEATRVAGLGASINETWFAMAQAFYSSPEYAAFNRNATAHVNDLYNTFFNRAPDGGGLGFWVGQLDAGMPREVALASFMFSTEFGGFTAAIFGNVGARAEVNAIVDFYRGLLARTPDTGGFDFWVGRFRAAQCLNAAAITTEVEAISSAFALSSEYAARSRTNSQYVGDLYNAFLRRGGDLAGVQFWINQVASGAQTREQVRIAFRNSAEFQARASAIIQQGCLPGS